MSPKKIRPLVRQGDDIYYGDMSDKFYIYMMIMNEADTGGEDCGSGEQGHEDLLREMGDG